MGCTKDGEWGTEKVEGLLLDFPNPEDVNTSPDAFKKMNKLRLLILHNVGIPQGLEYLPNSLQWLNWHRYPAKSLPTSFDAEKLVGLEMCYSDIVHLWTEVKMLNRLKYIDLSESKRLTRTPDLTSLPNLERLILEGCTSLVEIPPSVGVLVLDRLVILNLRDCENLKSLPTSIQTKSLETLILSGCLNLEKIPEIVGDMKSLNELHLDGTAIQELPSSIGNLTNLILINLSSCKNLMSLPTTICTLKFLRTISLNGCSKLKKLPENLGDMESLVKLIADEIPIERPPSSIVHLKNLKYLCFHGCKGTKSHSWSSVFTSLFKRRKYEDFTGLVLPPLSGLFSLSDLDLSDCNMLDGAIPGDLSTLSSLRTLNLSRNNFSCLPSGIYQLPCLETLYLFGCTRLEVLQGLPSSVVELYADECQSLKSLADLPTKYTRLGMVSFVNCFKLQENQQSNNIADMFLQYLLQVHAVANNKFVQILIPGRQIPDWFRQQNMTGSTVLQLPQTPNWHNQIKGLAMSAVFEGIISKSSVSVSFKLMTDKIGELSESISLLWPCETAALEADHTWLSYISFDRLGKKILDSHAPGYLVMEFVCNNGSGRRCPAKRCGGRVVYNEDVKLTDDELIL